MKGLLKLFGIYDLREEGAKWCEKEFGHKIYYYEFKEKYDALNSGLPIGGFFETMVFIDMIETIKKELRQETLVGRIRKR